MVKFVIHKNLCQSKLLFAKILIHGLNIGLKDAKLNYSDILFTNGYLEFDAHIHTLSAENLKKSLDDIGVICNISNRKDKIKKILRSIGEIDDLLLIEFLDNSYHIKAYSKEYGCDILITNYEPASDSELNIFYFLKIGGLFKESLSVDEVNNLENFVINGEEYCNFYKKYFNI